MIGDVGGECLM